LRLHCLIFSGKKTLLELDFVKVCDFVSVALGLGESVKTLEGAAEPIADIINEKNVCVAGLPQPDSGANLYACAVSICVDFFKSLLVYCSPVAVVGRIKLGHFPGWLTVYAPCPGLASGALAAVSKSLAVGANGVDGVSHCIIPFWLLAF